MLIESSIVNDILEFFFLWREIIFLIYYLFKNKL